MNKLLPEFERPTPCDLCASHCFHVLAERDRHGAELRTVICRACGLVTHADVASDAALADYYRCQYRAEYQGEYTPSPHRVVREWRRGRVLLRLLSPFLAPRDQVVEIGCGIGCTVGNFQRAGYSAFGIEPHDGFRDYGIERLGVQVRAGMLADVPRRPMADLILLVHVLEHLSSPTAALRHVGSLLRAGGRCYIEVPNAGAPHAAPSRMFHAAHIYNFTRDTLGMLAAKSGFSAAHWLCSSRDKNLRVLLQQGTSGEWQLVPGSYTRALRAATCGTPQYYFRRSYLRERAGTFWGHACDRILAKRRVERIQRGQRGRTPEDAAWLPAWSRMAWRKS